MRVEQAERRVGALGMDHRVVQVAQHLDGEPPHRRLILHHEDDLVRASLGDGCGATFGLRRHDLRRAGEPRQVDLHGRPDTGLGIDLDVPVGLPDEPENLAESEPGALADLLGGEERLEGLGGHLRRHAGPGVCDGDHHVLALRDAEIVGGVALVDMRIGGLDGQPAAGGHRVARVDGEVQERALELVRIGPGAPEAARLHRLDLDRLAERAPQQLRHAGDEAVRLDRLGRQGLLAGEGEEAVGQRRGAVRALQPLLNIVLELPPVCRLAAIRLTLQHVQVADDDRQHVVEVVGEAAGELAHRFHLLGLPQLGLQPVAVVIGDDERVAALAQRLVGLGQPRIAAARVGNDEGRERHDQADGDSDGDLDHHHHRGGRPAQVEDVLTRAGVETVGERPGALHQGVAEAGADALHARFDLSRPAHLDGGAELGELVLHRLAEGLDVGALVGLLGEAGADAVEPALEGIDGGVVGGEVALVAGQQVAALAGLSILQSREQADDLAADVEQPAQLGIALLLHGHEPDRRQDDGDEQDEAADQGRESLRRRTPEAAIHGVRLDLGHMRPRAPPDPGRISTEGVAASPEYLKLGTRQFGAPHQRQNGLMSTRAPCAPSALSTRRAARASACTSAVVRPAANRVAPVGASAEPVSPAATRRSAI
ncbi:hypothetical protein MMMDOFMJ_0480 [Methylobacterium gnaphalii]|nr:hypothetical protein MMMDOFMJ_0480 [Methylobacterium gnaphalii]